MDLGEDLTQAIAMGATHAGELSFARRRYSRELDGVDIVVLGMPFDHGTSNRPGTRLGPRGIREQSPLVASYPWRLWPWEFNVFERACVIDYSDVSTPPGYPERMLEAVAFHMDRILGAGASVLALGGDHSIAYPLLQSHVRRHGRLSLIHVDAHSDSWRATTSTAGRPSSSRRAPGSSIRRARCRWAFARRIRRRTD